MEPHRHATIGPWLVDPRQGRSRSLLYVPKSTPLRLRAGSSSLCCLTELRELAAAANGVVFSSLCIYLVMEIWFETL
ncbi:hypothetical protein Scep_020104 [Stephania cephalantha]|uniref:Uncharacterized protein n=1 Tax=Stephania cephalantha TaxID=152367 RepID=A0AAP0NNY6_9MAGN